MYQKLIERYWSETDIANPLEFTIYAYLVHQCYVGGKNPFIIETRTAAEALEISTTTFMRYRNSFVERGFILYKQGNRNKEQPLYCLPTWDNKTRNFTFPLVVKKYFGCCTENKNADTTNELKTNELVVSPVVSHPPTRDTTNDTTTLLSLEKEKEKSPPHPLFKEKEKDYIEKEKKMMEKKEKEAAAYAAPSSSSSSIQNQKRFLSLSIDEKLDLLRNSPIWIEEVCYTQGIDESTLAAKFFEFRSHCICEDKQHNSESDLKSHFFRWLIRNLNPDSYAAHRTTNSAIPADRAQRDAEFAELIRRNAPRGY